jgi:hypothetical protein
MSVELAAQSFVDIRFRAIVVPLVIQRFFHPRLMQIRRSRRIHYLELSFSPASLSFSHTLLEVLPLLPSMTTGKSGWRAVADLSLLWSKCSFGPLLEELQLPTGITTWRTEPAF